jgi:hypothetical protein
MYYTYGHYKADSKELFYIGKGKGNRSHEKDSRSDFWQNIVNKHGYTIEIFAEWQSEKDAFIHEKFLIECFRDLTELCNLTDGGDGCSGYVWTEEQKAKLKLRKPPRLGAVLSEKTRKQISLSQLGIKRGPHSKEHCERISLAHKDKQKSKKHVAKMSENAKEQAKKILVCPTCGHEGRGPNMYRYHFSNCQR